MLTKSKSMGGEELTDAKKVAWHHFLIAHAKVTREIDRRLTEAGHVNLDVYDILVTLEFQEDFRLRMSELAERKAFSRSGLTRLVDRLEEQGLIVREPCPDDKRGAYAVLTDKGQQVRELAWPVFKDAIQELWGQFLTDRKAEDISKLFAKMVKATESA